jgi:hypothetical protein
MGEAQPTAEVSKARGETRPRRLGEPQIYEALDGRDFKCAARIPTHDNLRWDIAKSWA